MLRNLSNTRLNIVKEAETEMRFSNNSDLQHSGLKLIVYTEQQIQSPLEGNRGPGIDEGAAFLRAGLPKSSRATVLEATSRSGDAARAMRAAIHQEL